LLYQGNKRFLIYCVQLKFYDAFKYNPRRQNEHSSLTMAYTKMLGWFLGILACF